MNKTKIEWTDYTWNPITGCLHGCPYCYARKITDRFPKNFPHGFEPHLYLERLNEPKLVKNPAKIFTVSMGDMFGDWVPPNWIGEVHEVIKECDWHQFQILTKQPRNIRLFTHWPKNTWLGTTIENQKSCDTRLDELKVSTRGRNKGITFVSFEPLQDTIECDLSGIDWVIIGAQTNPLKYPSSEAVQSILYRAREIPVFFKDNMKGCPGVTERMFRQEFPKVKG